MTAHAGLILMAILGFPAGLAVGYIIKAYFGNPPTDEQIYKYMGRIVNQEELEEHQRLLKFRMARNGQKTARFDGGPNARVMRVKVRPKAKRFRS